jgi:hypothetical protein
MDRADQNFQKKNDRERETFSPGTGDDKKPAEK